MKDKAITLGMFLLLSVAGWATIVGFPLPASAASNTQGTGACQCVTYVVNKLFGGPRPSIPGHNWDTAAEMATPLYWGNKAVVGETKLRNRSNTAQRGDIIIMQPDAVVYVWNPQTDQLIEVSNIGDGAGHVGVVAEAEYSNDWGGWLILMRSANWSSNWAVTLLSDGACDNVTDSVVFVPNGDAVSFWRRTDSVTQAQPARACIPPPVQYDPPNGRSFAPLGTIFRWQTNYQLQPNEVFDVMAWPENGTPTKIGTTRDKLLAVEFFQWAFAGRTGNFYWIVRIRDTNGTDLTCDGAPFLMTLGERSQPPAPSAAQPSQPQSPSTSQPNLPPRPGGICFYGCNAAGQCFWDCQ